MVHIAQRRGDRSFGGVSYGISPICGGPQGNTYLSRTIEVQEDQKVVDTGLYGIVRHPMYSVTLLMFLSTPLILGVDIFISDLSCLSFF